jgi:hypothetical protein
VARLQEVALVAVAAEPALVPAQVWAHVALVLVAVHNLLVEQAAAVVQAVMAAKAAMAVAVLLVFG